MNKKTDRDALRVEDWAGEMGERWLSHVGTFEDMLAPVGSALLARANYQRGERVVDIGCGGGVSSHAIAQQIAPSGSVVGVDISATLISECQRRAHAVRLSNCTFVNADAATASIVGAPFDRLHSRFGSMFFAEPVGAFQNLGKMLRSGGRADFAVWASAQNSPWVSGLMGVLRRHIDMPKPEPRTPGPFALDDPDYFGSLLRGGGFTDLDFHLWRGTQWIGGSGASPAQALSFVLNAMSFGDVAKEQPEPIQVKIRAELLELFAAHASPQGVGMEAIAWLVAARRQ
jgi:SAM-dependent methyltransferase